MDHFKYRLVQNFPDLFLQLSKKINDSDDYTL